MGCKSSKVGVVNEPVIQHVENTNDSHDDDDDRIISDSIIAHPNTSTDDQIIAELLSAKNQISIQVADPQAFNDAFVQQRQKAIDEHTYRSTIESWQPDSLQQLAQTIKTFSKGKSIIDRHWIIFYWITCNIQYDTVSYFSKDYKDQSVERVFQTRKGVCAGYAKIYKYLCEQLQMTCEVVGGYSKGYGFDDREGAPSETDHAWNAVEIDHHWYLIEPTWGAGYLNTEKMFEHKLDVYYFLARPNEMIYHHLPKKEKWQLLKTPIKMQQYMQMPKLRPVYFELGLQLISPCDQAHVDLLPDRSYALVLIRAPANVDLIADLKLKDQEIDGGHRIIFDKQKQVYCCYFAPTNIGKHKITIYGKRNDTDTHLHHSAIDLTFNVKRMPANPISFAQTWDKFFYLGLQIIAPQDTHLIKLNNGTTHTQILMKSPDNVELLGLLHDEKGHEVKNGNRVYYDRQRNLWRCSFAPDRDGTFVAIIIAKEKSDSGRYSPVVSFKIEAEQIPSPNLSYPYTWPLFYDLGLQIEAPQNSANVVWSDNASYAEVFINAPDDVQLSCDIQYNNVKIKNGAMAQFDHEKKLWQLLFAPERIGQHELIVFAKRHNDNNTSSKTAVMLNLDVTELRRSPMKFPFIYTQFETSKCQIYTPVNDILKKGSVVPIHCVIPGATDVNLTVDSVWLQSEGYEDPILHRQITVGSKEVVIYAKYGQKSNYDGLVQYTVQ